MGAIAQKDWDGIDPTFAEKYKFGHTKLFFKAGMIGLLEEFRPVFQSQKLKAVLEYFQNFKKDMKNENFREIYYYTSTEFPARLTVRVQNTII